MQQIHMQQKTLHRSIEMKATATFQVGPQSALNPKRQIHGAGERPNIRDIRPMWPCYRNSLTALSIHPYPL